MHIGYTLTPENMSYDNRLAVLVVFWISRRLRRAPAATIVVILVSRVTSILT